MSENIESQLDRLRSSILSGSTEESLALLEEVRRNATSTGDAAGRSTYSVPMDARSPLTRVGPDGRVSVNTSVLRHEGDRTRYDSAPGGLTDPLLGLESALRRHFEGAAAAGMGTGVNAFLTEIIMTPPSRTAKANSRTHSPMRPAASSLSRVTPSAVSEPVEAVVESEADPPADRRDLETPFPFHKLVSAQCGPHATLLERLYASLRFGRGTTVAYLLDTMSGDTQAAVLSESQEPGARCFAFTDKLVRELPACTIIQDTAIPREERWAEEAFEAKVKERARRYPTLAQSGGRLPEIDPRLDFAVSRPRGIIETLTGLITGAAKCRSSCKKARVDQFVPPANGHACVPFTTDSWIEVSIEPWACCVESYSIAAPFPITGGAPPRSWVLEACHGQGQWMPLREHVDDDGISNLRNYAVWDVDSAARTCVVNRFRLRRTGPDARHGDTFQVSHFEAYGRFMCCWPSGEASMEGSSNTFGSEPAIPIPPTRFRAPQHIPLPPEPAAKGKKSAKKR